MELQDRTGACPRATRNEGGAEGAAAVAASAVIGAAPWSDHDPYTDEAFSIRGRGTSGCATPVPPCGAQVRDVRPHPYDSVRRVLRRARAPSCSSGPPT